MIALLDLDETLVDRTAGFRLWARAFTSRWSLSAEDHTWLHDLDRAVKPRGPFFEAVHERLPATGRPADVWADYREQMPGLTPAFPGVLDELRGLRSAGWRLMAITNGRADNQVEKMRRTGIADVVDGWCVSEDVGASKPDPAIFAAALSRVKAPTPGECWIVGDDPIADIAGGRIAGLRTHWISHGRSWPLDSPEPDRMSTSPADALRALAQRPRVW